MRPHRKLLLWNESVALVQLLYTLCKKLPSEEKYALTSQLKRAATSVPLNIAEGAARNTKKEFIHYLYIAEGSLSEIDTILVICINLEYLVQPDINEIENRMEKVSALIHGLIRKLKRDLAPG